MVDKIQKYGTILWDNHFSNGEFWCRDTAYAYENQLYIVSMAGGRVVNVVNLSRTTDIRNQVTVEICG